MMDGRMMEYLTSSTVYERLQSFSTLHARHYGWIDCLAITIVDWRRLLTDVVDRYCKAPVLCIGQREIFDVTWNSPSKSELV
jgi:hypothetical protein